MFSYGSWAKKRIAELEDHRDRLIEDLLAAKAADTESFNRFKREERQRKEIEIQLSERERQSWQLHAENIQLRNRMVEHEALLDELNKSRIELKWQQRKVRRLEKRLNVRSGKEGYFGLATPSALKINKPRATAENQAKKGGAQKGHPGHGRSAFSIHESDQVSVLNGTPGSCDCGASEWQKGEVREHCVIERIPAKSIKHFYLKADFICPSCKRRVALPTPGVVQGGLYGNSMVAHLLTEHYLHGLTAGSICRRENIGEGTFFQMAERTAALLVTVYKSLLVRLRDSEVVHADETGWRNDGTKAYGWIFTHSKLAVFRFCNSRSGKIPEEIFGQIYLDINFITDRYKGYNRLKLNRQYCYVHLLRDLLSLEKKFPDDLEIAAFVSAMKPLLKNAISMHNSTLPPLDYTAAATAIKNQIITLTELEANHPGIQHFQDIFRRHGKCCFQWVKSPNIPAENNFAERALRPTVIARKISFGSQSDRGMNTRETLMTFLHTARLRELDPERILQDALNILCINPKADILPLLGF